MADTPEASVKQLARELSFDLACIASAEPFEREEAVALERLRAGLMGGLAWYTEARVRRGCRPEALLPGARSIISLAVRHDAPADGTLPPLHGRIARYARGVDYHNAMKRRMRELVKGLSERLGRPVRAYVHVDDGPMLDRAVAVRAGLGWYGKNSCLLAPGYGSWVLLGQIVTDLELAPDAPLKKSCGACVRCVQACPTGAIVAPGMIDNARCISYLTIENRGPIPRALRPSVGTWLFGCDVCQEVCPVNRAAHSPSAAAPGDVQKSNTLFQHGLGVQSRSPGSLLGSGPASLELTSILSLTAPQFEERFRGSALRRAKLVGLKRNACVVLGNLRDPAAVPALVGVLSNAAPLGRTHAAWALGRIGGPQARAALNDAVAREPDAAVQEEMQAALDEVGT